MKTVYQMTICQILIITIIRKRDLGWGLGLDWGWDWGWGWGWGWDLGWVKI